MSAQSQRSVRLEAAVVAPAIDRDIARTLSGQIAERHRLAFARSLTFAAIEACRKAAELPPTVETPDGVDVHMMTAEAAKVAQEIGRAMSAMAPQNAAYMAGVIYTTALPEAYRAAHGMFFTPPALADCLLTMAEEAGTDWATARVLDPSCGGGAILVPAALRMVERMGRTEPAFMLQQIGARLRGFEIDSFGAWLAQASLELALQDVIRAAGRPLPSVVDIRDSLDLREGELGLFDLVAGNPPYGRITPSQDRLALYRRSIYGHANLYGLFTDAALRWVKRKGVVAYLTPTSMLSGLYFKALRKVLAENAPPHAINTVDQRGGVFVDVQQETMLATYKRGSAGRTGKVGFLTVGPEKARIDKAGTFRLPVDHDAPWLLPRTPRQVALTRRLRGMSHRLSDYGYGVSTGPLVWNRFKGQFSETRRGNAHPVIWAESVTSKGCFDWRSEKRNHAPWFDVKLPKDAWLIVDRPCVLIQRTTSKEQERRLIAAEMPSSFVKRHKGVIVENHLNMVRETSGSPRVAPAVIAALLNSSIVDAAFRCINGSVAVSAFELEELPLPPPKVMERIARLVAGGGTRDAIEAILVAAYMGDHASATE